MSPVAWLVLYLVATAVLSGVAWTVQLVVYPAFALVGPTEWAAYHLAHNSRITKVVAGPWLLQGVATAALLLEPPDGNVAAAVILAGLALAGVVLTLAAAVPAHQRLDSGPGAMGDPALRILLRANLARAVCWTAATGLAAGRLL